MTRSLLSAAVKSAQLRIARPTDNLDNVVSFYCETLGFERLGSFQGHDGVDGVMVGHDLAPYHLEITTTEGHIAGRAPTRDNLLVFYIPNVETWRAVTREIESRGHWPVKSQNPYWDRNGKTYEDPDGYRVVIQNASWPTN